MALGTVDEHDFSIYASEVDHFSIRRKELDCVIIHLCHVVLLSLPTVLVSSLNTEVYCLCIDEEEVRVLSTTVLVCTGHLKKYYLSDSMINLMKVELYLRELAAHYGPSFQ